MKKALSVLVVLALCSIMLVACGGGSASGGTTGTTGDVAAGKALFAKGSIGSNAGCSACHTLDGTKLVGPSMKGIATRGEKEVPGQSAEQYIRNAIVDPNAFFPQGYAAGTMPSYKDVASESEINDLVAYLLTFK